MSKWNFGQYYSIIKIKKNSKWYYFYDDIIVFNNN